MWDVVDNLTAENESIKDSEIPEMEAQIEKLEKEVKQVKLQNRAIDCYQLIDVEKTVKHFLLILIEWHWVQSDGLETKWIR